MQVEFVLGAAPVSVAVYRIAHERELTGLSLQCFADRTGSGEAGPGGVTR